MALLIRGGGGDTPRNSCKGCAMELSKFPRVVLPYKSDRDAHWKIQFEPPKGHQCGCGSSLN